MKLISFLCIVLLLFSCKENKKTVVETTIKQEVSSSNELSYTEALVKVFDAHGGLEQWKNYRTLTYSMLKGDSEEKHTIDLYSRKDKIVMGAVSMGFDGENVWLLDIENNYKGDPIFYHNLMFYFYAMPFVLADDGIKYSEAENLVFEGKSYPGIRIGYHDGVGTSSKDEYYLHYDPETYQMTWLGYTVTYRSGEKSDNVKWIRYDDWVKVDAVLLPKSITWYNFEDGILKDAKNTVTFEKTILSEQYKPNDFYNKPSTAKVMTRK